MVAAALVRPSLNVAALSNEKKIEEALTRGIRLLGPTLQAQLASFFTKESMGIIVATLLAWAVAHVYGVGEATDFLLLVIGVGFVGWGFWQGLRDLVDCAVTALKATSERDLDQAAQLFAKALVELGINTLLALLLKRPIKGAWANRGRITQVNIRPRLLNVGPPPVNEAARGTVIVETLESGALGETSPYGEIKIDSRVPPEEVQSTVWHEEVHQFFSPKSTLLRQYRASLGMSGYQNSVFLRFVEEAIAETRAQVMTARATSASLGKAAIRGFTFPLGGGYRILATDPGLLPKLVSQDILTQGHMLGVVVVDGHALQINLVHGSSKSGRSSR